MIENSMHRDGIADFKRMLGKVGDGGSGDPGRFVPSHYRLDSRSSKMAGMMQAFRS